MSCLGEVSVYQSSLFYRWGNRDSSFPKPDRKFYPRPTSEPEMERRGWPRSYWLQTCCHCTSQLCFKTNKLSIIELKCLKIWSFQQLCSLLLSRGRDFWCFPSFSKWKHRRFPFTSTVTSFPSFPAGGSGKRAKKELFLVEVIEGSRYKSPGVFKC